MKKLFLLLSAAFFMAQIAAAQKTTVSATIVDPTGIPYANGSVTAQLVPLGGQNPTVGGNAISGTVGPAITDDNGHFSMDLFCNTTGGACSTAILPANTKWQFTVCNPGVPSPLGFGNQCFTPAAITITGTTQDVSTQMNAVAPQLTRLSGIKVTAGAPVGSCTNGQIAVDSTTGVIYTCQSGAWVPATPTSGVGAPANPCQPDQLYVDRSTGTLYTCNGGTWLLGGGGGTVSSFSYAQVGLDPLMSGAVANPSTTPALTLTAPDLPQNQFYASAPANFPLQASFPNQGTTSPVTVSGTPVQTNELGLFVMGTFTDNGHSLTPGAGWTSIQDDQITAVYNRLLASTAAQNISVAITPQAWAASLALFAATGTPAVSNTTFFGGTMNAGGNFALTYTNPTTAGHALVFIYFAHAGNSSLVANVLNDSQGNRWTRASGITQFYNVSNKYVQATVWVAFNTVGGSADTVNVNAPSGSGSLGILLEISNLSSITSTKAYFRGIAPGDLTVATGPLGFTQVQGITICASGCSVTATPCTATGSVSSFSQCQNTIIWPVAFVDANYSVGCSGVGPRDPTNAPNVGRAYLQVFDANNGGGFDKTATQFTVNTVATGNSDVHFDEIDCTAIHP